MATIEINGKKLEAKPGKMIIEVADEAGIHIPRFCYHKKLAVSGNCRMCMVEVERSPKPVPACATPISDGMRIFTKSEKVMAAQKAVMEFLLVNHPLDCPICDQGGECELQDLSMGYGEDLSHYSESKRVVKDEDLGPLIATNMTRCIHCTRCVRFGEEIAGLRELGLVGRGESTRIGTFIEKNLSSEISGNAIDLCPVGALTSKPFRFKARPWELTQFNGVAPHDCLGSNLHLHVRNKEILRVVPKENEEINETWLSDRDRFAYLGLQTADRLTKPMIKQDDQWQETDWQTALHTAAKCLRVVIAKHGPNQLAALLSANSSVEESYLLQKVVRGLGSNNIDHRLRQSYSADQEQAPLYPGITMPYHKLEQQQCIFLIGSHLNYEQPLAAVRVRKAIHDNDAQVLALNSVDYDFHFPVTHKNIVSPNALSQQLAKVAAALSEGQQLPERVQELLSGVESDAQAKTFAKALQSAEKATLIVGNLAQNYPQAATIRSLAQLIAHLSGAEIAMMTEGGNSAGCWLAGALPHRQAGGQTVASPGLTAAQALQQGLAGYVVMGVEPEYDCANPAQAIASLQKAECVVALSAYQNSHLLTYADVILPITPYSETPGTYVNVDGTWQSAAACVQPYAEARPAWKVLRVLGNFLQMDGFAYDNSHEVLQEVQNTVGSLERKSLKLSPDQCYFPDVLPEAMEQIQRIGETALYAGDLIVRRAQALQQIDKHRPLSLYVNSQLAKTLNLRHGRTAEVIQNEAKLVLPVVIDDKIADNCAYVAAALNQTAVLGDIYGEIEIR